jgi:hypothetical protein
MFITVQQELKSTISDFPDYRNEIGESLHLAWRPIHYSATQHVNVKMEN